MTFPRDPVSKPALTFQTHSPWPGRGGFLLPLHVRLAQHTQVSPACSFLCAYPFLLGLQPEALPKSLEACVSTKKGWVTTSTRKMSLNSYLVNENGLYAVTTEIGPVMGIRGI